MILNIILIAVGLILLTKGADFLITGAVGLSKRIGVSELFTGLTLVAFGTSAPELVVSVSASLKGSGIALGNVVGSNIANLGLILGLSILIKPAPINKSTIKYEIPFLLIISGALLSMILESNHYAAFNTGFIKSTLTRYDGVILLCFLIMFFAYLYTMAKNDKSLQKQFLGEVPENSDKNMSVTKIVSFSLIGIIMLALGGELTVTNSISLAKLMGISEALIGVTIVAIGTSLPELVTSIVASRKGSNDILIGNIIGSNVFNILFILGTSSVINSISPDRDMSFDILYSLIISFIVFLGILINRKKLAGRFLGILLLCGYIFYIFMGIRLG
ncbi:MAG TPA: calcium/sodium antiporter [Tepiditoga sp.]|mgnify:CR=1 FL=1|nr:calcium/sodium antiporter [Tepiditoga sp.]